MLFGLAVGFGVGVAFMAFVDRKLVAAARAYVAAMERLIERHDADRELGRCDGVLRP